MKHNRPGVSLGTILTLCLTAIVTAGCVFLFGKIQGGNPGDARMTAQRVIGAVNTVIQRPTEEPGPQSTVTTVTVTLAPATASPTTAVPRQAAPSAAPSNTVNQPLSFSLTAGGLLSFHSDISDAVYDKTTKEIDYRPIVSALSSKIYADLNLVTLPQIINTHDRKYDDNMASAAAADAVRAMGIDEVILGSEHILDQGAQGAAETVAALAEKGLICVGVNAGSGRQNRVFSLNGGVVAVLSYTDVLTAKSRNALKTDESLMQMLDLEAVRRDIQAARSQGARCVIVCVYWGKKDAAAVTSAQRNTAQQLAAMGADVILGTRPSRVLPMEIISCIREDGKAGETFVAYSLGSLLTESREGYDISGALLHLNINIDEAGHVRFPSAEYTPTYIWRQGVNGKTQYRVVCSADPAPGEMSSQQREVMNRALTRIQQILKDSPVSQRP